MGHGSFQAKAASWARLDIRVSAADTILIMDTPTHGAGCVCRACCDARLAKNPRLAREAEKLGKPKSGVSGFFARLDRMAGNASRRQADSLDKRAAREEDRAGKMARKHLRGGRRARKAMIAAEADRRKADRLRGE